MTPRYAETRGPADALAFGVDIGGTKVLCAIVAADGRVIDAVSAPTPAREGPAAILGQVALLLGDLASRPGPAPLAIGVGAAGTIGPDGTVAAATDILPGWAGTPVAGELTARMRLPTTVLNDVQAAAVGEARAGAAAGAREALVVAVGTGVGGGLVRGGHIVPGSHGTAGALGHMPAPGGTDRVCSCGALGHIEPIACGPGMAETYRAVTGADLTLKEIGGLAASGNDIAATVIGEAAGLLGRVVGGAINLLDPDIVVIGGGVAALGASYAAAIRAGAALETLPGPDRAPIELAALGQQAAVVGAALSALEAL